jgi:hypothetical protein
MRQSVNEVHLLYNNNNNNYYYYYYSNFSPSVVTQINLNYKLCQSNYNFFNNYF